MRHEIKCKAIFLMALLQEVNGIIALSSGSNLIVMIRLMRILIVSQYFWPEAFRINDLAYCLRRRCHEVRVLTGMPNYPSGRFSKGYGIFKKWTDSFEGVSVTRVPLWPRRRGGRLDLSLNYLSFVFSAIVFGLFRVRQRYDCLFVFGVSPIISALPAIVMKWFTGTPVVLWVQDLWPQSVSAVGAIRSPFLLKLIELVVRFIYWQSDLILIQSEGFRENVQQLTSDHSKIHYLPNWVEEIYVPLERTEVRGPALDLPDGFRVMLAGNIGLAQAMDTLVRAAEILKTTPDIKWIILGDGSERARIQKLVVDLGLESNVFFLGRLPVDMMPHYFAMADVLVVTLKTDPTFAAVIPSRIQSYLACGRPVIAALDGEGQRVVREAGAGLVGPSEDATHLAQNVMTLYRMSPEERAEIGRKGLAYHRQHFDRENLIRDLEQHLNQLDLKASPLAR